MSFPPSNDRISRIRENVERIRLLPGSAVLVSDGQALIAHTMADAISLLADIAQENLTSGIRNAILSIERKVGIDNSEDPESLDSRLTKLEKRASWQLL